MDQMSKSIDDILLSIESNEQAIAEMINTAKASNSIISGEMQHYARTRSCLNKEQMTAYAEYARAYDNLKQLYATARDSAYIESIQNIHNRSLAYSLLDEMHSGQISLMEQLCSMLEKARMAVKALCAQ